LSWKKSESTRKRSIKEDLCKERRKGSGETGRRLLQKIQRKKKEG